MNQKCVILAEDDSDDQFLFINFLSDHPVMNLSSTVANGEELIQVLENTTDDELPAAIILDQNMPKMNGLNTLQFLKANDRYAEIPVMVYSTYINDVLIRNCMDAGATLVFNKPEDRDGYHEMIAEFFKVI
jgi:CheY-like chemotaxis protein